MADDRAREVSLAEADFSFHDLAVRWLTDLHSVDNADARFADAQCRRS